MYTWDKNVITVHKNVKKWEHAKNGEPELGLQSN